MTAIDVVFFDAGETILHPHPSFPELFSQVCKGRGVEIDPGTVAEVQERLAPHLVDLAEDAGVTNASLDAEASRAFWSYLYRRFLKEFGIEEEELVAELYQTFSSTASYRLFDDVLPVLATLGERGYRLGLISNFEGWLEEMLVELEVGHIFDTAVISGIEGVEKPDPAIYRLALEKAGVEAERSVHIGDSPVLDAEPATSVGIKAVLLDRRDRYPGSRWPVIASLKELPDLLSKM